MKDNEKIPQINPRVLSDAELKFKDISSEVYRSYSLIHGKVINIAVPQWLFVSKSGGHRLIYWLEAEEIGRDKYEMDLNNSEHTLFRVRGSSVNVISVGNLHDGIHYFVEACAYVQPTEGWCIHWIPKKDDYHFVM
jgi:hypothetical protein